MPELPEVETVVRTLAPQIVGQKICATHVLHEKTLECGQNLLPLLAGATITGVARRGKLVLVALAPQAGLLLSAQGNKDAMAASSMRSELPSGSLAYTDLPEVMNKAPLLMAFHLKMTGRFFVHPLTAPALKHTRLIFDLEQGRLFFDDVRTFGYCRIMLHDELSRWKFYQGLGVEPLLTRDNALAQLLHSKKTTIKGALLDQHLIAGIGNIYADESLFRAGIRPDSKASSLPLQRLKILAGAVKSVLRQSIEECGSSIRDYRDANGNAGAFQNSFFVYGRKGQVCKSCGNTLISETVAGRGTTYCGTCQKA